MYAPYPGDNLLDTLFVALHLEECLDLADGQVLAISESYQLIEGTQKVVGMSKNFSFIQALACAGDDLGEEVERIYVLENVGLLVGDEDHV